MYAKSNLGALGRVHSNALMKSQSPTGFKYRPLSEIENSLEKMKAKKKKGSKSKSRSKENTPQNEKSAQRRTSIGSQKKNIYVGKVEQKVKEGFYQRSSKRQMTQFSEHVNSALTQYENPFSKSPSQLSLQSRNLRQSQASSCVGSEYQLPMQSQCSQKSVKFSDRHIEINMSRLGNNGMSRKQQNNVRSPSILKNKLTSGHSVTSERSCSVKSSAKLSRAKDLGDMENLNANKLVRAKYEALLNKYADLNKNLGKNIFLPKNYPKVQKYTDDIFPPQNGSIFSYSIHSKTQKPKSNLSWKRIPELYNNNQNLIVLRPQQTKSLIKITKTNLKNQPSLAQDYLLTCFNCIRQNTQLLQKMFEIKETNIFGVYLVKIFQENAWKFLIVDDFIPTIYDDAKGTHVPAFINVQKAEGNASDTIQIWPYLIEKAYAAYYSKYQALKYGTEVDFLAQLTGVPYKTLSVQQIQFETQKHLQFQNLLREQKCVLLGQKVVDEKSTFFCILPDLNSITKKSQGFCTWLNKQKVFKPNKQRLQTLFKTLTKIYIYELNPYLNVHLSYLCPQSKKQSEGSFKMRPSLKPSQTKQEGDVSLRCFTITQTTKSVLSIRQKDCKFYFQGKVQYQYIWIRAILLLKQHNGDYRWIDGQYSNTKIMSFFVKLQPGEYFLLLMPEWHPAYKYDATVSFFTECPTVAIQKRAYIASQEIFQKGCADIAQREGTMNQINKYICAYNYVSEKTGLVIENINNQRQSGPVTVMRSINGLKCQAALVPVNKQFYFSTNSDYDTEATKRIKKSIEVDIEGGHHFTVVLKTVGGIDKKFFESFDFGS